MTKDKEGFDFEEDTWLEEEDPAVAGEGGGAFEEEESLRQTLSGSAAGAAGRKKKSSPARLVLLVVLLLVAAGAGFYFWYGMPQTATAPAEDSARKPVAKKTMPVPTNPEPKPEPAAREPSPPAPKVAEASAQAQSPEPKTSAQAETPAASPPESAPETAASAGNAPASEEVASTATDSQALAEEAPSSPKSTADEAPLREPGEAVAATGGNKGNYVVNAGAYLLGSNLKRARQKIGTLGFEPRVQEATKPVKMIRLRVGVYNLEEARAKVEELREKAPDAFLLPRNGQTAVYAASFHDLDRARHFADLLYGQGIRVVEEPTQAELPMKILSFGDFGDLAAARRAAAQAEKAGLDAYVAKRSE